MKSFAWTVSTLWMLVGFPAFADSISTSVIHGGTFSFACFPDGTESLNLGIVAGVDCDGSPIGAFHGKVSPSQGVTLDFWRVGDDASLAGGLSIEGPAILIPLTSEDSITLYGPVRWSLDATLISFGLPVEHFIGSGGGTVELHLDKVPPDLVQYLGDWIVLSGTYDLTPIPEPSSLALLSLAMALITGARCLLSSRSGSSVVPRLDSSPSRPKR